MSMKSWFKRFFRKSSRPQQSPARRRNSFRSIPRFDVLEERQLLSGFQMRLEQVGVADLLTNDNGPGDGDPTAGVIRFIGSIGTFNLNVTVGNTKPVIGDPTSQKMDLSSFNLSSATGGTLQITLADTGYALPVAAANPLNFLTEIGGTLTAGPGSSVSFQGWAHAGNQSPFDPGPATAIPAGSVTPGLMGPFGSAAYSGGISTSFTRGTGPYAMFCQANVVLATPGNAGFNGFLTMSGEAVQPAALGDFVWEDVNANGVQDAGEPGINGVTVKLLDSGGNVVATTTTDNHPDTSEPGYYLFDNLTPGDYSVMFVSPAGYMLSPQDQGSDDTKDSDADVVTGMTQVVTLQSGEMNLTLDAGLVEPRGSISGKKYKDLTGNGLTADDTPLGGTTIKLYLDMNGNNVLDGADGSSIASTVTASGTGAYAFNDLAPGVYFVKEVVPTGYVRTAPALSDYHTVVLGLGVNVMGKNFANFKKCDPCAIQCVRYVINNCRTVYDLTDNVQQGDTVKVCFTIACGCSSGQISLVSYTAPGPTFVAADAYLQEIYDVDTGTFGPGSYCLEVKVPNCYFQIDFVCGPPIDRFGPAGSNIFYTPQCRLIDADNGGCNPCLPNGASLSGNVYLDSDNDGRFDSNERGIAGVTIKLYGTTTTGQQVYLTTVTDSRGFYVFDNLKAGTYKIVEVDPSNYADGKDRAGTAGGTVLNDRIVDIVLAQNVDGTGYNFGERPQYC